MNQIQQKIPFPCLSADGTATVRQSDVKAHFTVIAFQIADRECTAYAILLREGSDNYPDIFIDKSFCSRFFFFLTMSSLLSTKPSFLQNLHVGRAKAQTDK